MHGKKRSEYKAKLRDSKTAEILSGKAEQWHQLVQELARRRCDKAADEAGTTMALLEKALLVNPDPLHLWNHRREWILLLDGDKTKSLESELALTQAALQRNPKAYGAWMHRKWILQHVRAPSKALQSELLLTTQFLKLDERNFHCWNYRRFVVGCLSDSQAGNDAYTGRWADMGVQLVPNTAASAEAVTCYKVPASLIQTEWAFTTEKIKDNFSNFSAFYYRSQLLPRYLEIAVSDADDVWLGEFQLIENAVCTEPDDQTAWWYQALLLSFDDSFFPLEKLRDRLGEQADLLRELLDDSPNSKWVLLGLHRLLDRLQLNPDERRQILQKLQQVDPDRSQRYQELFDQVVLD